MREPGERVQYRSDDLSPLLQRWIGALDCATASDLYADLYTCGDRHVVRRLLHLEDTAMEHAADCCVHLGYALDLVRAEMAWDWTDEGTARARAIFPLADNTHLSDEEEERMSGLVGFLHSAAAPTVGDDSGQMTQKGAPYAVLLWGKCGEIDFGCSCLRWQWRADAVCGTCGGPVVRLEDVRVRAAEGNNHRT